MKKPLKADHKTKASYKRAIVNLIKYERKQGATFKEIAENFNEQNIEVLEKGIWHLQSVYRIFKESELK